MIPLSPQSWEKACVLCHCPQARKEAALLREKVLALCQKHRAILLYLVFGVLTTAVNYITFMALLTLWPGSSTIAPNLIAWIASVLFAYGTNRTWVFRSQTRGAAALGREILSFFGARLFSLVLDLGIVYLFVDRLGFHPGLIKLASNVLVVILNYLFSKFWIFRSPADKPGKEC
jgi:putative flippase GtrA